MGHVPVFLLSHNISWQFERFSEFFVNRSLFTLRASCQKDKLMLYLIIPFDRISSYFNHGMKSSKDSVLMRTASHFFLTMIS